MKNPEPKQETDQIELIADFGETFGQLIKERIGMRDPRPEEGQLQPETKPFGMSHGVTS